MPGLPYVENIQAAGVYATKQATGKPHLPSVELEYCRGTGAKGTLTRFHADL